MKNENWVNILFGVFALVGTILLVVCFFVTKSSIAFEKKAINITGTIVDIESYRDSDGDRHYTAYVDYEYEGQEYLDVRLSYYSSSMDVGDVISLKIDPEKPGRVKAKNESLFACIMLGVLGIAFSLFGFIPLIKNLRNGNRVKELRERGRYIYGIVERVDINYNYSMNGRHPFVLYCYYEDEYSGTVYKFKSDNIWTDPTPVLPEGSQVRIFIKDNDYSNYHVDVMSSLQNRIVDYT